jgi:thiol-disulfide isomerase/thioredoxin
MKKSYLITIVFALLAMIWIGCSDSDSADTAATVDTDATSATRTPKTLSDQPAAASGAHPAQKVSAVDLDGQTHQLSEWIGKQPLVINLWGTWCPPCRREIPGLVRLYDEYRSRGVEIVSLALEKRAGPAQVKQFTEQAGMKWIQLIANENVGRAFNFGRSVPVTIFLDKDGREVSRHVGARPYERFRADFELIATGS